MDRVHFTVNGIPRSVGSEQSSDTSLNDFLRRELNLRGTKYMCQEGGCGACVVAATAPHLSGAGGGGDRRTFSVNSCLVSITSCQDWEITTIEDIGNRKKGYHPIQRTLAEFNGSQCGYCTPGFVMSMYSLLESNKLGLTRAEIENSFGSNLCRCTGYRPILDAFKSFATDNPASLGVHDIEDLPRCSKSGKACRTNCTLADDDWCIVDKKDVDSGPVIAISLKDHRNFYRVNEIRDVFNILNKEGYDSYMLVAGNTAKGAYPIFAYPRILIDISGVKELKYHYVNQNLILGAGNTLTDTMSVFKELSEKEPYFSYLAKFVQHLDLVAHIPVRNIGTIGGNLMVKHKHNEFSSDPFLLFETVGGVLTLIDKNGGISEVNFTQFLQTDMTEKIIVNVKLPPLSEHYLLVTYKIMPRAQNAHAHVNAGFLYHMDSEDMQTVLRARIVFGGISAKFVHASRSEFFLIGRKLFKNDTLRGALTLLSDELVTEEIPPEPSPAYRKKLALGLFYKGLLQLSPPSSVNSRYVSGNQNFRQTRPLSRGKQVFDTNKAVWPVSEPMPKIESLIQCAAEAPFVDDIPTMTDEVFAAFVLTTVGTGEIEHMDPSPALELEGVVAFYSAKDIPGINSFQSPLHGFIFAQEEILCNGTVKFYSQPLGIIVALTEKLANRAAKLVKVTYKAAKKGPIITIRDAKKDVGRVSLVLEVPAVTSGGDIRKVIVGGNDIFWQYHFTMESQTCVALPSEDGLTVYSSAQGMNAAQQSISEALKMEKNRINMSVARIGGGYGAKISRNIQVAASCSLVSLLLNRPCRFAMSIESVMRAIGKRLPCSSDFEVAVNGNGEIQRMTYNIFDDNGYIINEPLLLLGLPSIKNCYDRNRWHLRAFNVVTDTHSNTWCRSPGTLECMAMTEYVMEQISYELGLDPIDVRLANINKTETIVVELIENLRRDAEYDKRKRLVKEFNVKNRWKKRGLAVVPMSWPIPISAYYNAVVAVYSGDGSVVITHGAVEMGQGLNTKAVQVCAYTLNIPLSKIKVKRSDILTSSNSIVTGGAIASESVCYAVIKCCQLLLDRIAPIRAQMPNATWEVLIQEAYMRGILLLASYNYNLNDEKNYRIAGVAIVEAELDLLTGEHLILRADVMEDVGQSLNPEIDIGQVEGAFIMGVGYWTSEHLVWDHKTGELLTNRTWDYNIPSAKDIPIDFRVTFRRNSFNPVGVLGSRATGEPATCMALAVAFALREAIASSRTESGRPATEWFRIDGPYTAENMILAANVDLMEFKF